ncbi:MAG: UTP--glucose-1-phosphate uridylyltransferase, partial [Clostridia bacterium]|nr:UTP--glucose-1-phosphate uridylyltransferase [Clostridia bacterium]
MKITKAVIPAAGFGTRFLPATKAVPKEMLPIVDKPTIQYIGEEARAAGIEDIILITSRGKDALVNHFDKAFELEAVLERDGKTEMLEAVREVSDKINVHFIRQQEQKGLGHAVLYAKSFIGNEPFAVMLGDDVVVSDKPCIGQLIEQYEKIGASVLGVQKVGMEHVSKYGIVDAENVEGRLYKL